MFLWYWSVTHLMEFLSQRYTHRILQTSVVVKDSCYVPEIQYGYIECLVKLSASDIYHGNLVKSWKKILIFLRKPQVLCKHLLKLLTLQLLKCFQHYHTHHTCKSLHHACKLHHSPYWPSMPRFPYTQFLIYHLFFPSIIIKYFLNSQYYVILETLLFIFDNKIISNSAKIVVKSNISIQSEAH